MTMIDAFHKAQPKRGERILIQTATGGTGLIALQLARYIMALEVYATAGSRDKAGLFRQRLVFPICINYRAIGF